MQMRSWAVCLGVVGVLVSASTASAAPKKKGKAEAAAVEPAPIETPKKSGDVDSLMEESTKKKSAPAASSSSEAEKPAAEEPAGEPDAWERPPADEEKPKKKLGPAEPEKPMGDGRNMDARLMVGYGFETTNFYGVDPYGLGFGLRGSYELDWHLVIGLGFEYFIGQSSTAQIDPISAALRPASHSNYMLIHADVGYNIWFGTNTILRPSIWAGVSIGRQSPPALSGQSGIDVPLSLAPGLNLDYIMGRTGWFVGLDGRINLIIGQGASGIILWGVLGKRF
jgi:hypothetical protein